MYRFNNDYAEGAHPRILELLQQTNLVQTAGYGEDPYCAKARALIAAELKSDQAEIYFIPGGTQANLLAISAALRPHEAVIAAATGHINVHETGAIEATGHKVLSARGLAGKLTPAALVEVLAAHTDHHMVKPRLVYISQATELGTVYSRAELEALSQFCRDHDLLLYLDGARLAVALTAQCNDLDLAAIARLTDCFSIGGTKNGALFGEALVLAHAAFQADFPFLIKQRGALLAKGRLLGLQFQALFTDGLFYENGRRANALAQTLKEGIAAAGYGFLTDSPTNQLFPLFPPALGAYLAKRYDCHIWSREQDAVCLRVVTSWATPEAAPAQFLADLQNWEER